MNYAYASQLTIVDAVRSAAEKNGAYEEDPLIQETLAVEEAALAGDDEAFTHWCQLWWTHSSRRAWLRSAPWSLLTAVGRQATGGGSFTLAADLLRQLSTTHPWGVLNNEWDGAIWIAEPFAMLFSQYLEVTLYGTLPYPEQHYETAFLEDEEPGGCGRLWQQWAHACSEQDGVRKGWMCHGACAGLMRVQGIPTTSRLGRLLADGCRSRSSAHVFTVYEEGEEPVPPMPFTQAMEELAAEHPIATSFGGWGRQRIRLERTNGTPTALATAMRYGSLSNPATWLDLLGDLFLLASGTMELDEQSGVGVCPISMGSEPVLVVGYDGGIWMPVSGIGSLLTWGELLPPTGYFQRRPTFGSWTTHGLCRIGWLPMLQQLFPEMRILEGIPRTAKTNIPYVHTHPWIRLPDDWCVPGVVPELALQSRLADMVENFVTIPCMSEWAYPWSDTFIDERD